MRFEKKLIAYGIGNVASKMVSIALLPIYTRHIASDDYGRADIANTTVTLVVSIVFIEIWTALLRFIYEEKDDHALDKVFSNIVAICALLVIPFCIVQAIANRLLGSGFTIISLIYGLSFLVNQLYQFMARGDEKNHLFVYSGIVSSAMQCIVAVVSIYIFHMGATVILLAPSIGYLCSTLYIEIKCKYSKTIKWSLIEKSYIKKLVLFSAPLALNTVAFWLISNFNRYYIAYSIDFESSSYIAIASKFTMIISLATSIYSLAWQESAYENSNLENRENYYSYMLEIYIVISVMLTVLCLPISKLVFPIMTGEEYHTALILLVPYFIATFLNGISSFFAQIFSATKSTGLLMISTITGSVTNIITMIILAPLIGILAAPISSALGFLVNIVTRFINIRKYVKLRIDILLILKTTIIILIASIIFYIVKNTFILLLSIVLFIIVFMVIFKNTVKLLVNRVRRY